jgi:hypothetical protein
MTENNDKKSKDQARATYTAKLARDFNQRLRQPLTKSMDQRYPVEENTPEIVELLERLNRQKQ